MQQTNWLEVTQFILTIFSSVVNLYGLVNARRDYRLTLKEADTNGTVKQLMVLSAEAKVRQHYMILAIQVILAGNGAAAVLMGPVPSLGGVVEGVPWLGGVTWLAIITRGSIAFGSVILALISLHDLNDQQAILRLVAWRRDAHVPEHD